ncbi:hypothetical protein COV17_01230 [Candidatus Woesearchaeota archaeon CG10_big_fil_rev_8_21_14_0_10_36_11]|nr:MAG: hypothetical protein COV17_01230 [Candidatus Woesearchaeota archaeon CG10_big_fil_rev_8_21_14_0_10_36_11]
MKNKDVEEGKVFAFLGIFLTIIGFLIVLLTKKDNKYAMFYAKQGLVLFIVYVIVAVANMVLMFIPFLGWLIMFILGIGLLILWIIGIVYSLSGEEKEIPLIGSFAKKIHI